MRLLLPLRSSETLLIGSAHSARATSWMSSAGAKEGVTDLVPRGILLELGLRIAAEEDLAARRRHVGVRQDFGKVVDEHVAPERPYSSHLVIPRAFEIDVLTAKAQARHVEEAIVLHPVE